MVLNEIEIWKDIPGYEGNGTKINNTPFKYV
jgi:hypothetical protein